MRGFSAEFFLLARRRAAQWTALFAVVTATVLAIFRFLSTSADVAAAEGRARADAEELVRISGVSPEDIEVSAFFSDPRYLVAADLPLDLAAALIALGVLGVLGGALVGGADWRTGTIVTSFVSVSQRSRPMLDRLLAWTTFWTALSLILTGLLTGGLILVGGFHGSLVSTDWASVLLVATRGLAVSATGAAVGFATGVFFRSELVVILILLAEVLVLEVAVSLAVGGSFTSPGTRLARWVLSIDNDGNAATVDCDAMACADVFISQPNGITGLAALVFVVAIMVLLVRLGSRRPLWR